jgi:hypothetical protein
METSTLPFSQQQINTRLSLRPLVDSLKNIIASGKPGAAQLYEGILEKVEQHPELLEPIDNPAILQDHSDLVDTLIATIFPPTKINSVSLYSVAIPFTYETIYNSRFFKQLFLIPGTNTINIPDNEIGKQLETEKREGLYHLILKKFLQYDFSDLISTVYPFPDPATGLTSFLELQLDTRFVDVRPVGDLPVFPDNVINQQTNRVMPIEEFFEKVPLSNFIVEGLIIVRVNDVTQEEIISQVKNLLLNINALSEASVYDQLQTYMRSLLSMSDVKIGITPFFKVNGHYVYSELHNNNSLLFKNIRNNSERDDLVECYRHMFQDLNWPVVFSDLDKAEQECRQQLDLYYQAGARSLIICPLKLNGELLGVLEIVSDQANKFNRTHIAKIESAIPLFALAIEKGAENLNNQIDKVIKKQFTAIQPSVEWKFTETALNHIIRRQVDADAPIERINFPEVYPLYGAIDIRNSSVERAQSIQLDLLEQLQKIKTVLKKAQGIMAFPLLQEIEYKTDKYITAASDVLQSDEETQITDFLKEQVVSIFQHLKTTMPGIRKDIEAYFKSLDPQLGMLYLHRKEYEDSIAKINDAVSRFIDKEQIAVQQVYPHYFERYVTDGVEFNVYIGQSIAPRKKFDDLYLRNMKMWQLTSLAKAARLTHELSKELPHPMKTTQLILAHSTPISISFRTAERKFDVDGAYNIRYEIVKKRIDKVHIKSTNERLTQPGKIAIVYSQPKEAEEYMEYIEFLQNLQLLKPGVEHHDLEELQGVVGLKGLRVDVNYEEDKTVSPHLELSNTTTKELLGK